MSYTVQYGKRTLHLDVPEERVAGVLAPKRVTEVEDVAARVGAAIARPHESKPLAEILEGKRTALLATVNNTRPSPRKLLLPIIRLCRKKGVRPSVMIATGRHRQMTAQEIRAHLGRSIVEQCEVLMHDG